MKAAKFPQLWIILRVLVVLIVSWGIASYNSSTTNLNWLACLLISTAGGVFLFLWLQFIGKRGNRSNTDWTNAISLTRPFFPMNRYPIRYWLLVGLSLIVGGAIAFFKEVRGGQHASFGTTFIALGVAFILAVCAWMRVR